MIVLYGLLVLFGLGSIVAAWRDRRYSDRLLVRFEIGLGLLLVVIGLATCWVAWRSEGWEALGL